MRINKDQKIKFVIFAIILLNLFACGNDCGLKENIEIVERYKNGQIAEKYLSSIIICDTIKQGYYYRYSPDGVLLEKSNFKDNLYQGSKFKYYKSGALQAVSFFNNGKVDSIQRRYYENGQVKNIYNFSQDIFTGEQLDFYENGRIKEYSIYDVFNEEKLLFIRKYDLEGKVTEQTGTPFTDMIFNSEKYKKGDSIKIKGYYAKPPGLISEITIIKTEDNIKDNKTVKIINPKNFFIFKDIVKADSLFKLDLTLKLLNNMNQNIEYYSTSFTKDIR